MKLYKVSALVYADFMLMKTSKWKLAEYLYFPITTVLIWGMFSNYVSSYAAEAGFILLAVNILWNFANLAQSHVDMAINEDSWSGSLKQIIITGVSDFEYIAARLISSTIMSFLVLAIISVIAIWGFGLAIFVTQWQLFAFLIVATWIASLGMAIFVAGAMIALGREYGFLAWTVLQIFIFLSAPFFPMSLFPGFMQPLIQIMPYSWIFEATRTSIQGTLNYGAITNAAVISVAYFIFSLPFYNYMFRKARQKGWLVRLS